ncbi:hypothetical protein C4D60_Mb02t04270 [Musa balbisiana]|uniref:Uncharacterized protein n=1 Tax=Musa balbisiana TaxID=52838 RepID=A0A4S8I8E3_MUSBA|nr:hypothetical protein C4D60_Mb02t04270 [Musa balbisiana]
MASNSVGGPISLSSFSLREENRPFATENAAVLDQLSVISLVRRVRRRWRLPRILWYPLLWYRDSSLLSDERSIHIASEQPPNGTFSSPLYGICFV